MRYWNRKGQRTMENKQTRFGIRGNMQTNKQTDFANQGDTISKQAAIEAINTWDKFGVDERGRLVRWHEGLVLYVRLRDVLTAIVNLPSVQPERAKYEYHYDHTDCIWYRPEARNRCPTTCAQYRDGWNDAMNYIFRDGKGYRPFRRDRHYEE